MRIEDIVDSFIPYTGVSRKPRREPPRIILIHATRGPGIPENQYGGTINHVTRKTLARRLAGWGPMTDLVVGSQGKLGQIGDWRTTRSNWSAGRGGRRGFPTRTWGADEHAVAFELAQTNQIEPMTEVCLDKAAKACALLATELSIPLVWLPVLPQAPGVIPTGFTGHEDTANGKKWGKSDPGWSPAEWKTWLELVKHYQDEGVEARPPC